MKQDFTLRVGTLGLYALHDHAMLTNNIVYTLWRHPGLLPLLHTPESVLSKLRTGADLMTPGLAGGPPFPTRATKNSVVAIASLDKPSVPMVVGICEIDVSALKQVQGLKGHAVRGVHWDGDEIWAWSQSGQPGGTSPAEIEGWMDDEDTLESHVGRIDLEASEADQNQGGVALDKEIPQHIEPRNDYVDGEKISEQDLVNKMELSTKGTAE